MRMKELRGKIGLEIHVQLNTKSKLFCGCITQGGEPNTATCEICLGMPGSKPTINAKAVEFAIKLANAFNCKIATNSFFARKTYFYPDMSKNFQITQYEKPIAADGSLDIKGKFIRIRRIQLEEDPAALKHPEGMQYSNYVLIDYNRAGTPLCEIVTEPDIETGKQARELLEHLAIILEYIGIFDPQLCKLRTDVNISVAGHERVEVKNITGFANVEKAINYEIVRQESRAARGESIKIIETYLFDEETGTTQLMRAKESEEEYGYIYEPDLVVLELTHSLLAKIKKNMPELPQQRATRFVKIYKINKAQADSIISELAIAELFESVAKKLHPQICARWITVYLKKVLNYNSLRFASTKLTKAYFETFLKLIITRKISQRGAELLLRQLVVEPKDPQILAKEMNLFLSKEKELIKAVKQVLSKNPKAVADYKSGKEKALQYLVGAVVKETKGRADAKSVLKLLKNKCDDD